MIVHNIGETAHVALETVDIEGDFSDPVKIWQRFLGVVNQINVTILATQHHIFPNGGLSGTVLIAESHVAIHTWPEENRAWCVLATCGDPKSCKLFSEKIVAIGE